jgi:hypothetical protein
MPYRRPQWIGAACAMFALLSSARADARGAVAICNDPKIGCESGCSSPVEPFVDVTSNSITIQHRDQCLLGDSTTVFARRGYIGGFAAIDAAPPSTSWKTTTHSGLDPRTTYCFYTKTVRGDLVKTSEVKCKGTEPIRCGPPVIGGMGNEPFVVRTAGRIDVQYHDQCAGESSTRVYHRAGTSGAFSLIKSDGYNQGGWRVATVSGLHPDETHCFYVETTVDGHEQQSPVECTTTPPPACAAPQIGSGIQAKPPFTGFTPDSLTVQYTANCSQASATAVYGRPSTDAAWTLVHNEGSAGGWREATHAGLQPDTRYCYHIASAGPDGYVQYSGESCRRTPQAFQQPGLSQFEATSILQSFDWSAVPRVAEDANGEPILYYTNLFMRAEDVLGLRQLGAHIQTMPIFESELADFSSADAVAYGEADGVVRQWFFAAIPGEMFNMIRDDTIAGVAAGYEPLVDAMVLHQIPVPEARRDGRRYQLDIEFLGSHAFDYNARPQCFETEDFGQVCQDESALVGWLTNKLVSFATDQFIDSVQFIGDRIGQITKLIRGEVELDIDFVLDNTDPGFYATDAAGNPIDTVMRSGWRGTPIELAGVTVRVRQGIATFTTTTDENGHARLRIAKNLEGRVCITLENKWARLTRGFYTEDVCVERLERLSTATSRTIHVRKRLVNVLAQMSDAGAYSTEVLGYEPPKISVLVGPLADLVSTNDRSFAPCLGRSPTLTSAALDALLSVLDPAFALVGAVTAYDVILVDRNLESRGVAVHEYGHTVMCALMAHDFETVFPQLMLEAASQGPGDEAAYLTEGFADFMASQVVGGTDYFGVAHHYNSNDIDYARSEPTVTGAISVGLDEDFKENADGSNDATFTSQVRRVASLLHDFFDGSDQPGAPNSGIHWRLNSNGYLVHDPRAIADDDDVVLGGRCLPRMWADWRAHESLLSEDRLLKSLARVAIEDGAQLHEVCDIFERHSESQTCPGYVAGLTTLPNSSPCSLGDGGGGGGGGSGGHNDPPFEDGGTHQK